MNRRFSYRPIAGFLLLLILLSGCGKQISKRVSLWRNDKIPYGTWYAWHHLSYLFPKAEVQTTNSSPVTFYGMNEKGSAYIIIGHSVEPDEKELKAILNYAIAGNHVFVSALSIGQNMLDSFRLSASDAGPLFLRKDSLTLSLLHPDTYDSVSFSYPGLNAANYFTSLDSSVTTVLGKDFNGNANFVKLTYQQGGSVLLHLAPAAFTNFFLLHADNKHYYDLALSSLPDSVNTVWWDDYYRTHSNGVGNAERSNYSKLSVFLSNEVLRWVFWLSVLLFAIIYIFESKRKQRVLPVIKALNNTSLDFVKTVGRLYYQQKDNKNLAEKMAAHFLSHIRLRYHLPTAELTDDFVKRLSYKSGYSAGELEEIVRYISDLENKASVSDEELLAFNNKTEKFYKQT